MAGVTFTQDSAKRIANVVKTVEREGRNTSGGPANAPQLTVGMSFKAKLLGASTLSAGDPFLTRYSWMKIEYSAVSGTGWVGTDIKGDNAVDLNAGQYGADTGIIYTLTYIGEDPDGKPTYVFEGRPPIESVLVKVHDHSSNLNGGLAFGTFHPGSSLPGHDFSV